MGYDPFTADAPEGVVITLTRSTRGSTATVKFNEAGRARGWDDKLIPISDDDCIALVRGAALYLPLQFIDISPPSTTAPSAPPPPTKASPPAPRTPAPPAPGPPASAPPAPARAASAPAPSPSHRSWRGEVGISPFVAFGIAPGVAFGGALQIGLHWPSLAIPFSIAAEVHVDGSLPGTVDGPAHARVTTLQVGGAVVPCWRPLLFLVCGVVKGSEVYAKRTDISDPKDGHNASFQAGLRVGVGAPIHDHLGLGLHGDVLGTLKPAEAKVDEGPRWGTPRVVGGVGVTLLGFF
jgi:hypothetical protein